MKYYNTANNKKISERPALYIISILFILILTQKLFSKSFFNQVFFKWAGFTYSSIILFEDA
ncbi:hypothetical protein BVY03_05940 [bacterium K02(2017)]|nr:hypothetical protein BVY03_05940 [bacterium K02(2017)]